MHIETTMKIEVNGPVKSVLARNHFVFIPILVSMCISAGGCGRGGVERASISGTVTLNGNPVSSGSIRLVSLEKSGGPSAGGDIENGQYDIAREKGPSLGRHRVEIYVPYTTGRKTPSPFGGAVAVSTPKSQDTPSKAGAHQNEAGMVDEWSDKAPLKYNRESILEVNIESGSNEFDIHMESK